MLKLLAFALTIPNIIANCYTQDSYAVYSKDEAQITLHLAISENPECDVFPPGVEFNLTLGVAGGGEYISVVRDFSYRSTEEVSFVGITQLPPVFSCYVRVFDYGHHTDFEVIELREEMSNLQNCFEEVVFNILRDDVRIDVAPTGLCANIFSHGGNALEVAKIAVENEDYQLNKSVFLDNYGLGAKFSVYATNIPKDVLYKPFITAELAFELEMGTRMIEFSREILKFVSEAVPGIVPSAIIGQWGDKFFVRAEPDSSADISAFMQIIGVYDEVDYRISFRSDSLEFKYLLRYMGEIDHQRGLYHFDCLQLDSPAEIAICLQFYSRMSAGVVFDMVFDIIFKYEEKFLIRYEQPLQAVPTCWSRAVQMVNRKHFCLNLEWNSACPETFTADVQLSKLAIIETGVIESIDSVSLQGLSFLHEAEICVGISENNWLRDTGGYFVELRAQRDAQTAYIVISDTVAHDDYFVLNTTVIVIGSVYVAFVLLITIRGVVATVRSLRKAKQRKQKF